MMADRVLVFASDPGRVRDELPVKLTRPREVEDSEVRGLIDKVYGLMTEGSMRAGRGADKGVKISLGDRLPEVEISRMEGALEILAEAPYLGRADLPRLAEDTELSDHELLDVASALTLLGFAQLEQGDIMLTALGSRYALADHLARKIIFGQQLLSNVPLIAYIRHGLVQDPSGDLHEDLFIKLLHFTLSEADTLTVMRVAIEWGRYGELFEYDFNTGILNMPENEEISTE